MASASIIVPTRSRPDYLAVTLASIAPQASAAGAEVIVVDDGGLAENRRVAGEHGARYLGHPEPRGPNAARNTGIEAARSDLLVFVDDDVRAPEGWLDALLAGARRHPDAEVLGGPIRVRLEGFRRPTCGREGPPVTFLDLGPEDRAADFVWSANMAVRRSALERVGPFDAALEIYGDEEEWQRRHRAGGGRTVYVAAAGLEHRRAPRDASLRALSRAALLRGRNSRRYDELKGSAPSLAAEVATLARCAAHGPLRRCAFGAPMTAAAWGRVSGALRGAAARGGAAAASEAAPAGGAAGADDFLSGGHGAPAPRRAKARDLVADAELLARGVPWRLRRAARRFPPTRRVLAVGVERPGVAGRMPAARAELERSRHDVEVRTAPAGERGRFENLNALLAEHGTDDRDWLVLVDDDVALPTGFLDGLLFLAERFDLVMAQPAHRHASHAAWEVTRRRRRSLVRQTPFVEIGPVLALHRSTFDALLPFPDVRMGWGVDAHWAAVARERGWRVGILDALPVLHDRPVGRGYETERAIEEARRFLAERAYLPREESQRTLAAYARW